MKERPDGYVPAAGYDWLLPLYDPLVRLLDREGALQPMLLEAAQIRESHRVLDVGCGTGTFVAYLKSRQPDATVVGLDGDPKVLAIARRKATERALDIRLDLGLAYEMPYADGSFDRAVSSLVFHHMNREHKGRALAEIQRVLAPGGLFLLTDFGPPLTRWNRVLAHFSSHGASLRDKVDDRLPTMLEKAGFESVLEIDRRSTIVGSMWTYRGRKTEA